MISGDAADTVVWADDGPLVVDGVNDLVVVRANGVTFVTTRARATHLKKLLGLSMINYLDMEFMILILSVVLMWVKTKLESLSMKQFMSIQTWLIGFQEMNYQKLMLKSLKVRC